MSVRIFPPSSEQHDEFEFCLDKFLGKWSVVFFAKYIWKNLPIFLQVCHPFDSATLEGKCISFPTRHCLLTSPQDKKDVSITYAPHSDASSPQGSLKFDDLVEYYPSSAKPGSKPSTVAGTDHQLAVGRFKWRGNGLLFIASSRWQILGCNTSGADGGHPWAVTFFEKTLFTPAGLDIYARSAEGLPEPLLKEIFEKIKALGGGIATLSEAFFEVERTETTP